MNSNYKICIPFFITMLMIGSTANMQAQSSTATVSGKVTSILGEPMEGVIIHIVGGNTNITLSTDEQGRYSFPDLPKNVSYALELTKAGDPKENVDILDVIAISKHILGQQPLENYFLQIAADVNRSSSITTFDIVETRKLILDENQTWPNNSTWQFIYSHSVSFLGKEIDNLQQDIENLDFTGVKTGDVNLDAGQN